jgi:hypothetical protein
MHCRLYSAYERIFLGFYHISIVCLFHYALTTINIHLFIFFIYHWTDILTGVMATSTIYNQDPVRICSFSVKMNNTDEASSLL